MQDTIERAGSCILGADTSERFDMLHGRKTTTDPNQLIAINLILDTLNAFRKICDKYEI